MMISLLLRLPYDRRTKNDDDDEKERKKEKEIIYLV